MSPNALSHVVSEDPDAAIQTNPKQLKSMLNSIIRPQKLAEEKEVQDRLYSVHQSQLERANIKLGELQAQTKHMTFAV